METDSALRPYEGNCFLSAIQPIFQPAEPLSAQIAHVNITCLSGGALDFKAVAGDHYRMRIRSWKNIPLEGRRELYRIVVMSFICLLIICSACFPALLCAGTPCASDAEYQVYAEVLFPQDSDSPTASSVAGNASGAKGELLKSPDLEGIWPGPYLVFLTTTDARIKEAEAVDHDMGRDFAEKNQVVCVIDKQMFSAAVTPAKQNEIAFISDEQRKAEFAAGGWDAFRRKHAAASCLTSLSRVGFNSDKTKAMVDVRSVCDYEMGIGYRVLLKRSSGEHPWKIVEVRVNRTF